jgi:energy-coupling factor transporter ATP-binding protein EcfA2
MRPTITFEKLFFSDGTTVELNPEDIIVFVGPNNVGKTAALRDLEGLVEQPSGGPHPVKVIKSAALRRNGTTEDVLKLLEPYSTASHARPLRQFHGFGTGLNERDVADFWPGDPNILGRWFCHLLRTDTRLTDSNAARSFNPLSQSPSVPIQSLYLDDTLEERISVFFNQAFGQELVAFRLGGSEIPLLVGKRPQLQSGEDRLSIGYNRRLRDQTVPLAEQGDGMRSFATVLLRTLTLTTMSILLLDEPETFLHPPQARLLGEILATQRLPGTQLFIATHSQDVLDGLLNAAPGKLRIIRLERDNNLNKIKELDRVLAERISCDPLMRFTSVLSGVFHRRVLVCESDADCMFYSTVLGLPAVHGDKHPDVLFVQAGGKQRMAAVAETLRALDVSVDVVVDIDILNNLSEFERLVLALRGDWAAIVKYAKPLKTAIEQHRLWKDAREVATEIRKVLDKAQEPGSFPQQLSEQIKGLLSGASPWEAVKKAGNSAIPAGDATQHYHELKSLCEAAGLWLVPVGELEGFCRSQGGHGPRWVQSVLEKYDPATSCELFEAREFVRRVWNRGGAQRISENIRTTNL